MSETATAVVTRTPMQVEPGMVIMWPVSLFDDTLIPQLVTYARYDLGHGIRLMVRPVDSPYARAVFPHPDSIITVIGGAREFTWAERMALPAEAA